MKLIIENFGPIKEPVTLEPKLLTVLCGANNTGKTYALYILNALMDSRFVAGFDIAKAMSKSLFLEKSVTLKCADLFGATALRHAEKSIGNSLKGALPQFFVADPALAETAKLTVQLDVPNIKKPASLKVQTQLLSGNDKEGTIGYRTDDTDDTDSIIFSITGGWHNTQQVERELNRLLMNVYLPDRSGRDFLLPAERSGINLFFRELNSRRATLLRHVTNQTLDTNELLKDIIFSRYPQPIHDYIEFLSSQPEIKRQKSDFADLAAWLQKDVLRAKYKVDRYGDISIAPLRSGAEMGLHLGSSTVKTFFGLWSYLNHLAREGDWLMIDEPELNLHPQNQMAIARLLAQLVKRGIRVVVSTHSDYMVRQWSNLIMLGSQDFEGRDSLAKQYGLPPDLWLSENDVAAIEFNVGGANAMAISGQSGIRTVLFDESILHLNQAAQDIYFARQTAFALDQQEVPLGTRKVTKKKLQA